MYAKSLGTLAYLKISTINLTLYDGGGGGGLHLNWQHKKGKGIGKS